MARPRASGSSLLRPPLLVLLLTALEGLGCLAPVAFGFNPVPTDVPPLFDVPVWSLATLNADGETTNLNLLTYASPVSIRPDRQYALGLFKQTLTYENLARGDGQLFVLQLLTERHIPLVRILGGTSGRDGDKMRACTQMKPGLAPIDLEGLECQGGGRRLPMVLPGCAHYLVLSTSGDLIDGGFHDTAICRVEQMLKRDEEYEANSEPYLSTGRLRELGIITEAGRIADE